MKTMEWNYKNHNITVDENGFFVTKLKTKDKIETRKCNTLLGCKNAIDSVTKSYYEFTESDLDNMMKKLDNREKDCLKAIIEELNYHSNNSCCNLGIVNKYWDWKFIK